VLTKHIVSARTTNPNGVKMSNWKELVAHSVTALITAAGAAAIVYTTDIRTKADLVKNHSADSSSLEASAIAKKIRDDIKQQRPDITISGSL
jgi:hypothetical protein